MKKKFGHKWGRLLSFWGSTSWILKKIIPNFKLINSKLFAKNATLLRSMVCSVDQFKVFHRGCSSRPIGRDALARSILRGVCAREKQKFLFFGPASVYETSTSKVLRNCERMVLLHAVKLYPIILVVNPYILLQSSFEIMLFELKMSGKWHTFHLRLIYIWNTVQNRKVISLNYDIWNEKEWTGTEQYT